MTIMWENRFGRDKGMKKRIIYGVASAALTAVMCVAAAGCGAASIKGSKVSKKEWDDALDYFDEDDAVYTITCNAVETEEAKCEYLDEILSGSHAETFQIKAIKNEAKEYIKTTEKTKLSGDMKKIAAAMDKEIVEYDETTERYAEYSDGKYTTYSWGGGEDGKWQTGTSNYFINLRDVTWEIYFDYDYNQYEYSPSLKGYIPKNALEEEEMYVVKFNGKGQLIGIYYDYMYSEGSGNKINKTSVVMSVDIKYSAKKITLPAVG